MDFYFSFGDIPYGFHNVKSRFTDEITENDRLMEFERNKGYRRIGTLQQNIRTIGDHIESMKEDLIENKLD